MNSTYNVDNKGYYGEFGGAYIPEMMYSNIEELRSKYIKICSESSFKKEFDELLKDYVGRPTPLYFASRLSEKYNTKIYLKREDLCHTGAHKINNTIGQILLAKKIGQDKNYCRDRCRSTWRSYSYCLCVNGNRMYNLYG